VTEEVAVKRRRLKEIKMNVVGCARCGKKHVGLVFIKLKKKSPNDWSHWATCPNTSEPLMLLISDD